MPLYLIKPQNNVRLCVMIYQACGLDKKTSNFCLTKVAYFLAGVEGFEPSNVGVRVPCLTTWRHPNVDYFYNAVVLPLI